MKRISLFFIGIYQKIISAFLPNHCRFSPSCSEYARQAILAHGLFKGVALGAVRVAKCHPFSAGGVDLVPAPPAPRITKI